MMVWGVWQILFKGSLVFTNAGCDLIRLYTLEFFLNKVLLALVVGGGEGTFIVSNACLIITDSLMQISRCGIEREVGIEPRFNLRQRFYPLFNFP